MSVYLITWDLNKEKPNYAEARAKFVKELDGYENTKDVGLDSVRFISTNWSAQQISEDLEKKLDNNDRLVVVSLKDGSHQGWLSENTWDWIKKLVYKRKIRS